MECNFAFYCTKDKTKGLDLFSTAILSDGAWTLSRVDHLALDYLGSSISSATAWCSLACLTTTSISQLWTSYHPGRRSLVLSRILRKDEPGIIARCYH